MWAGMSWAHFGLGKESIGMLGFKGLIFTSLHGTVIGNGECYSAPFTVLLLVYGSMGPYIGFFCNGQTEFPPPPPPPPQNRSLYLG